MDPKTVDPEHARRCDPRYEVALDAVVTVPLDDGSNTCLKAKAAVENVSLMGIRLRITVLNEKHIPILPKTGSTCSVTCTFPGNDKPVFLTGKIAWLQVHADDSNPTANLGLHLTETPYGEHLRLLNFLEKLKKRG